MELLRRAVQQAPDPTDGLRRSRFAIVRNTFPQLRTTSMKTIAELLRGVVSYRAQDHAFEIKFGDIESEWLCIPLDTAENVQRLLSLDLTGAWVSELRELPPQILLDVLSRCGRYPSMRNGGPTWYGVIAESNSWNADSPWNTILEERDLMGKPLPATWGYWVQPGARDPYAENVKNLVPGYYQDLVESNSKEWAEQYVDNRVTPSLSGEAVFRASFRTEFHVAKQELIPVPGSMLIVGMDFGRNPAVAIIQLDPRGRLIVLEELMEQGMGCEQFVTQRLRPLLAQPKYNRLPAGVVGDPSGISRGQIGEESVFQMFKRLGLSSQPAQTNNIEPRLRAVEKWLLSQRDGGPALLIDPSCKTLILSLQSRYRYARRKNGTMEPTPEKKHPYSDICFIPGTLIATPRGAMPIERLEVADTICIPGGVSKILAKSSRWVPANDLVRLTLSDGSVLTSTKDHPFAVVNSHLDFLPADALTSDDILVGREAEIWAYGVSLPLTVVRKDYPLEGSVVHNIKTQLGVYYAGSALVHNCDALQYGVLGCSGTVLGRLVKVRRPEQPKASWKAFV